MTSVPSVKSVVTPGGSELPTPEHRTLTALGKALGYSAPALSLWRKNFPDAPASLREQDWREFILRNGLGTRGNKVSKSREALLTEKTATDVRLNEIKIAKELRNLIDAHEVNEIHLYFAASTKAALYQMVAEAAPKCAGLEVAEVRRILREHADIICVSLQGKVEEFQKEQEAARAAAATAEEHAE